MREAGAVVANTIKALLREVRPGITTGELDALAHKTITQAGAKPSFLGYRGFPGTICTSINEEIVHGIPGKRVLKEGDILSLDVGAIVGGFHGDSATTVPVGKVSTEAMTLMEVAEESLNAAIRQCRAGARMGDVSWAVQQYAESKGFSVVKEYVGHGIGRALHEEPSVPNFGAPGRGLVLRPGMVLAIEPMVNVGVWKTRVLADNWTVVTEDGKLSAHYEHTIAINEESPEVLTAR
ncbi:MAG: methionine aminopeptidase [Dehalococcoidia bacterium]|nr:methionine aminopeptidase [Dehalococcoidia bacterium]